MKQTWQWKPNQRITYNVTEHRRYYYGRRRNGYPVIAMIGAIIAVIMVVDLIAKML